MYVHTVALPGWVPITDEERVVRTWSDGMYEVVDAFGQLDRAKTADIMAHPDVSIGERQVLEHLREFVGHGVVRSRQDPDVVNGCSGSAADCTGYPTTVLLSSISHHSTNR